MESSHLPVTWNSPPEQAAMMCWASTMELHHFRSALSKPEPTMLFREAFLTQKKTDDHKLTPSPNPLLQSHA
jgi:hypothetical protein